MKARWYAPAMGRFISPDTIVPDPTNPQTFNRYSYVNNNPIRYTDPTGHCGADTTTTTWDYTDPISGQVTTFSNTTQNESAYNDCISVRDRLENLYGINIVGAWSLAEMGILENNIYAVDRALSTIDISWSDTPLNGHVFTKGGPGTGITAFGITGISSVNSQIIPHEIGHAIDSNPWGIEELHDLLDENSGNCGLVFCNRTANSGYAYNEYGDTAHREGFGGDMYEMFRQGETWGQSFSAWVYHAATGHNPPSGGFWTDTTYTPAWADIYSAVEASLIVKFGD